MGPLALPPEQDEQFDGVLAVGTEPVRDVGVELRGLARLQDHASVAEEQQQPQCMRT